MLRAEPKIYFNVSDVQIAERHMHLKETIDTLVMEDEAYTQSFYMAWMFFPIFIFIGIGQVILFVLYNNKYHPFQVILKGATKKGKGIELIQHWIERCSKTFPSLIKKAVIESCHNTNYFGRTLVIERKVIHYFHILFPILQVKGHYSSLSLGADIEMAVIMNENPENSGNPNEMEMNSETSPGEELQPLISNETATIDEQIRSNESEDGATHIISEEELEPLLANETSTVSATIIIDEQATELQTGATNISLNSDIVVTITNEMEMTESNAKTEANYDTKGIYVISSSHPIKCLMLDSGRLNIEFLRHF